MNASAALPARIVWTVAQARPRPSDDVLEIGCGNGTAAALIASKLTSGSLVALDRSATAAAAARKRLATWLESGHARVERADLLSFGRTTSQTFDLALASNVNVFWQSPLAELETLKRVLRPRARLTLVFEPPSSRQLAQIGERCEAHLMQAGFRRVTLRSAQVEQTHLICVGAWAPASPR